MNKYITAFLGPLLLAASALPSAAATVYAQDVAVSPLGAMYTSQNDTGGGFGAFAKVYDDFSLSSTTTLTDVHWYGGFFNPEDSAPPIGSFLIQIWADDAGAPGAALYAATIDGAAGQTLTGHSNGSGLLYAYDAGLAQAFVAQAGTTYWLSIQAAMDFPPQWGWASATGGDGLSVQDYFDERVVLGADMAFSLTGTPAGVPEPGSLALAGLALLGLLGAARTKKSA